VLTAYSQTPRHPQGLSGGRQLHRRL